MVPIRLAGLEILAKLSARLSERGSVRSCRLTEYLLPLKEEIVSLAAASEIDSEPKVLELAATVKMSMKAWP